MRRLGKALNVGLNAFAKEHARQKNLAKNLKERVRKDVEKVIKHSSGSETKLNARQRRILHHYMTARNRLSKNSLLNKKKLDAMERNAVKFALVERKKEAAKLVKPRLKMRELNELIEIAVKEHIIFKRELKKLGKKGDSNKLMVNKEALKLVNADLVRYTREKGKALSSYTKMRKERKNE